MSSSTTDSYFDTKMFYGTLGFTLATGEHDKLSHKILNNEINISKVKEIAEFIEYATNSNNRVFSTLNGSKELEIDFLERLFGIYDACIKRIESDNDSLDSLFPRNHHDVRTNGVLTICILCTKNNVEDVAGSGVLYQNGISGLFSIKSTKELGVYIETCDGDNVACLSHNSYHQRVGEKEFIVASFTCENESPVLSVDVRVNKRKIIAGFLPFTKNISGLNWNIGEAVYGQAFDSRYNGYIAGVNVYNKILSDEEIGAITDYFIGQATS